MPNIIKGNKYTKKYSEDNVQKAVAATLDGMSKHKASQCFGVPRSTLQFRLSNNFAKTKHGPNPILTKTEEDHLVTWILKCCKKGFPCRKEDAQPSVKYFLNAKPGPNSFCNNFPGDGWYTNFFKYNPIIVERTVESVTRASACATEAVVRSWFKNIEEYLIEENLFDILRDSSRIFSGDETFLSICPKLKQEARQTKIN